MVSHAVAEGVIPTPFNYTILRYNYYLNKERIEALTKRSFELLRNLHQNGLTHGDAKADQLVWVNDGSRQPEDLRWLDLDRALDNIQNTLDTSTWNLRKLMDINLMLLVSAYSLSSQKYKFHFSEVNLNLIRKALGNSDINEDW